MGRKDTGSEAYHRLSMQNYCFLKVQWQLESHGYQNDDFLLPLLNRDGAKKGEPGGIKKVGKKVLKKCGYVVHIRARKLAYYANRMVILRGQKNSGQWLHLGDGEANSIVHFPGSQIFRIQDCKRVHSSQHVWSDS